MNILQKITEFAKIGLIKINALPLDQISNMSENLQYAAVLKDASHIKQIKNPSEKIQLAAVKQNPKLIAKIENPTEAVQEQFMKKTPNSFFSIKNPSEKTLLTAVAYNAENIRHITFPSEEVQKVALQNAHTEEALMEIARKPNLRKEIQLDIIWKNPMLITLMPYPNDEVQLNAVLATKTYDDTKTILKSLERPSDEVQRYILDSEGIDLYAYLKNKTESIELDAVNKYGYTHINNQSPLSVQEAAIKKNPANIRFLHDPCEEMQLLAIKSPAQPWKQVIEPIDDSLGYSYAVREIENSGEYIKFIKNPTELAQRAALDQDLSNIHHIKRVSENNARYALERAGVPKEIIDKVYSLPAAAKTFIRDSYMGEENKAELIKNLLRDYGKIESKNLKRKQQVGLPIPFKS